MALKDIPFLVQLFRMSVKIILGGVLIIALIAGGTIYLSKLDDETAAPKENTRYTYLYGNKTSPNRLLRLEISGPILGTVPDIDAAPLNLFSQSDMTFGYVIKNELLKAAKDDSIKGVFLHISSPGGTIFGSMAIYDGIKAYQNATHKPIVAYIEGMSASGGVMAMVGADAIYADVGSMVGSIGVIGGTYFYYDKPIALQGGLFSQSVTTYNGIEQTTITAGKSKDVGNPFRRMTDSEKAMLQEAADGLYEKFVAHVAAARNMSPEVIKNEMGAQIYSNDRAQEYGLIDGTKSWDGALADLAERAGVADDYQLVRVKPAAPASLWDLFASAEYGTFNHAAQRERVQQEVTSLLCATASSRALVYYGNPLSLCPRY